MHWSAPGQLHPTQELTSLEGCLGPVPAGEYRAPEYGRVERQAFVVRMRAARPALRVHYHPVDQFQVFCWGGADFAGHEVAAGTVHYADRFTPYGPLEPLGEGVSFLTLRAVSSSGAHYMPESRAELSVSLESDARPRARRRNVSYPVLEPGSAAPDAVGERLEIARSDADGLLVAWLRLPPHGEQREIVVSGAGAFVVVIAGGILLGERDQELGGCGSLAWCDPGAHGPLCAAGQGATLALLQFPRQPGPTLPGRPRAPVIS